MDGKVEFEESCKFVDSIDKLTRKEKHLIKRNMRRLLYSNPPGVKKLKKKLEYYEELEDQRSCDACDLRGY